SVRPSPEKQTELARTGSSASGFSVATSQSFRPKSPFFAELYHATASTRLSGENAKVKLGILRAPLALPSWLSQTVILSRSRTASARPSGEKSTTGENM